MSLIPLFHTYTKPDDTIDKPGLLRMLQESFPHFLSACVSRGAAHGAGGGGAGTLRGDRAQGTPSSGPHAQARPLRLPRGPPGPEGRC